MEKTIVLKKYANRRLYNTDQSEYITLNDLADLVRNGKQVKVIDAHSKEDVTAFILTQILLEEAKSKNFLLPTPVLHQIIRYADNILLEFFDNYLSQIIQNYIAYRQSMEHQFQQWLNLGMGGLSDMSKANQANINPFNNIFSNLKPRENKDDETNK